MPPAGFEPTISAGERPLGPALTSCLQTNFTHYVQRHKKWKMKKELLCLALDTDVRSFIKSVRFLLCPFSRNLRIVFLYFSPLFTPDLRLSSTQLGQDDSLINVSFTVRLFPISAVNIRAWVSGGI